MRSIPGGYLDQICTFEIDCVWSGRRCPDGVFLGRIGCGRRRLPDHQDRHQPLLRQDEGRRDRQGRRTRRDAEDLCRQDRRRQRKPGRGDRNLHRRRRQGHPARRRPTPRPSCRPVQEGARRRHPRHRARHAARADRRRRRDLRHRQLQGRRTDRRMGRRDARRQAAKDAKIAFLDLNPSASRPSTCCATRAS